MNPESQGEVVALLREELQEYLRWLLEELGEDYYVADRSRAAESLEEEAQAVLSQRARSERAHLWDRDRFAFYQHPNHPSVYKVLEQPDLEIIHYLEEFTCDHVKMFAPALEEAKVAGEVQRRYEQSFGVLLASQAVGWMYRLDFCEVCGLVEIWSMEYSPEEIALFAENS
jgi:hypothetical protein